MAGQVTELYVAGTVSAPPEQVFGFLSDLDNHWLLTDGFVEPLAVKLSARGGADDPNGAGVRVRIRLPACLRRAAATRVSAKQAPHLIVGTAELSGGTRARVSWTLSRHDGSTWVHLGARVERASSLDRLLLRLGGRAWLCRRFAQVLARLARRFDED